MPKTRDGVEVDGRHGTVWVIQGGLWPSAIIEYSTNPLWPDEIERSFSSKAAAVDAAQRRLDALRADCEREHAANLADIANRQEWIDGMRADLAKATIESAS